MDSSRRRILQGAAAGALFLPLPGALVRAQTEDGLRLQRLPKLALVIGNGSYKAVPPLVNPGNDARAIAEALKRTGFEVSTLLDGSRADMLGAIQAHVRKLKETKCVGLFYFAGHGLQLAWRNYLVPVEAMPTRQEDVARHCVEVGQLMEGLSGAANPMNVIILDACRNNPFGRDFRDVQQGLSQMDAPTSTLLAYATAPGNVASDGEGANGLYTEHLLKEMQVRETKIEDVFKRVRLGVRRKTNGAQMPWESTSLEEDFYFLPPEQIRELSDAEQEREFQEQLATWEKIKGESDPAPLIEFLTRHPSSHFSELAQQKLNRLLARRGEKKVQVQAAKGNPFSKGTAVLDTNSKVGDSYTYRLIDPETNAERRRFTMTITEISDAQVVFNNGLVTDLQGNTLRMHDGRRFTDNQNIPVEFAVGKQWTTRYHVSMPQGQSHAAELNYVIVSRETLTVPAGTFNTFLIEGTGSHSTPKGRIEVRYRFWWDPEVVRRPIAREETRLIRLSGEKGRRRRSLWRESRQEQVRILSSERQELTAFKQS